MSAEYYAVWGAGGQGRVVADLLAALGHQVAGFIDRKADLVGSSPGKGLPPVRWLEQDFLLGLVAGYYPGGVTAIALGIGDNAARAGAMEHLVARQLPALTHPSAVVSRHAELGNATVVLAGAVINHGAVVGSGAIINTRAIVEHDAIVGRGAHLSPGAILCGAAQVGECAWLGAGAIVLPGVHVGARSVVGAGAVVLEDLPPDIIAVGNPAHFLRSRAL